PKRRAKQTEAIKEGGPTNERGAMNQPGAEKGQKNRAGQETNVSGQPTGGETNEPAGKGRKVRAHEESANAPATGTEPGAKQEVEQRRKGIKEPAATEKTSTNPAAASANAPPVSADDQQNMRSRGTGAAVKKPEP